MSKNTNSLDKMEYFVGDAFAASKGQLHADQIRENILKTQSQIYIPEELDQDAPENTALKVMRDANGRLISAYSVDPHNPYDAKLIEQDYQGALNIAEQRLLLDPKNPDLIFDKAFALELSGSHEEAFRHYRNVLALEPSNTAALNNAGNVLAAMGRVDEAISYYNQALSVDTNDVTASLNLAEEYRAQGNYQMYYNQIDATLKMSPSRAEDKLYLAELKKEQAAIVQNDLHMGAPQDYQLH